MKEVKILYAQTLIDIAMQELGSAERAMELAIINNISLTEELTAGTYILVPSEVITDDTAKEIIKKFTVPGLKPASFVTANSDDDGIEFWGIEETFEVQ